VHHLLVDLVDVSELAKIQPLCNLDELDFGCVRVRIIKRHDHGSRDVQELSFYLEDTS
jgi:hypothetical protein